MFKQQELYSPMTQVFVSDSRISVSIHVDTWVLVLYRVEPEDEATYECHVNSEPPQKVSIHLFVKGEEAFLSLASAHQFSLFGATLSDNM